MKPTFAVGLILILVVGGYLTFTMQPWEPNGNGPPPNGNGEVVKVGMIGDIHQRWYTTRYDEWQYSSNIQSWIGEFVSWGADFAIQLGDISADQNDQNQFLSPEATVEQHRLTWDNSWHSAEIPLYNVMGNHELGSATKMQILALWGRDNNFPVQPNVAYYSFDVGDFHFVVLDNHNYECANQQYGSWAQYHFEIWEQQKQWLIQDLQNSHKPTIGFVHVPLSGFFYPDCNFGNKYYNRIINAPDIWQILSDDGDVVAWFEAHFHNFYDNAYHWTTLMPDNRGNTYPGLNEIHFFGLPCSVPTEPATKGAHGFLTLDSVNREATWTIEYTSRQTDTWTFTW